MNPLEGTVQRVANRFGLHIIRVSASSSGDRTYEVVQPSATYCPWNVDEAFRSVFAAVRHATLVDEYRCWELWKLVEQSATLLEGDLIEVGVWRGGTGALIASRAGALGIPATVYLCDTFRGVVKAGDRDTAYRGGEHADTSRSAVEQLLFDRMRSDNVEILEGVFPDQTGDHVRDATFRFCHIDVDTYDSARDAAEWLWDRLVPGGLIVYDDYGFKVCPGVTEYVEEQVGRADRLVLHNLNGHAIVVKR